MFRWKVIIYKTDPKTGKVYQVEKEFTDPREYEQFVKQNSELSFGGFDTDFWPSLSIGEWANLERWIEDLIWRRFGLWFEPRSRWYEYSQPYYQIEEELPVDLSKYEIEVKKLEEEKRKKQDKIRSLKEAIKKLEEFKKKFEEVWDREKIKQIDEDIKKVKDELKKLESRK